MYTLSALSYDYAALEPHFDAQTMRVHHDKHHQTYLDKLNQALAENPALFEHSAEELVAQLSTVVPEALRAKVRNFGGGYINHNLFWEIIAPQAGGEPNGVLMEGIQRDFGSFAEFRAQFTAMATTLFGSGWVWLVVGSDQKLQIMTTANQDSPLTQGLTPVLGLDVWEHAYYLKYQNRRPEFIEAFWQVVNWSKVAEKYQMALK